jgi:CheY-like chemotaxis protein
VNDVTVLVVEDNPATLFLTCEVLALAGLETHAVETLSAARRALSGDRFDAILLDMRLPDGSGVELARFVRSTPRLAATPIIACSAEPQRREEAMLSGCDGFLCKPIDVGTFAASVLSVAEAALAARCA